MRRPDQVLLGVVVGAHGIRGAVRIKSYTADPAAIGAYGAVNDADGARRFEVDVLGVSRGAVLARLSGVRDRNAAEALRGLRLYVPRSALPATGRDEYYHADLIGLAVETRDGTALGTVRAIHNFGAGDVLEVARSGGGELLLPFTGAAIPEIDLARGRIVADPAAGAPDEPDSPSARNRR